MPQAAEVRQLHLYFTDGSEEIYEFAPSHPERPRDILTQIHESRAEPLILLELDDRLVVIHRSAVRKIELAPKPDIVPEPAFRNVRRVA
ncbi:hypothetical protein [Desulfoferrobacter suflitae]|uniref:hypothetical protein n=1 Tax=Desulfoferrobacter suflitae TaxID=2865782 RepID=UPI00216486D0|nr:hypothetical protein [Desulfoferrobacter suflitae]MCK8604297.1 hypothetical protein [Desulfoferrobacter suflitae]